jgi:DNA-binding NarL/FixJ family response regulator
MEAMLTAREKEILVAIASGSGNTEISDEFNISLNTVKTHVYNIYKKIDVRNRLEATLWVARYL